MAAQKTRLSRAVVAGPRVLDRARLATIAALYLGSEAVCAGPEPDAGYKLLLLVGAAVGLIVAQACAVGCVARLAGRGFWRWSIAQLAATGAGLALFGWVLGTWLTPAETSVLDMLSTDLVFETWSSANLSLLAVFAAFSGPVIALALLVLLARTRSRAIPGPR